MAKPYGQHVLEAIAYNLYRLPGIIMSMVEQKQRKGAQKDTWLPLQGGNKKTKYLKMTSKRLSRTGKPFTQKS
jgi:hypothetical protein